MQESILSNKELIAALKTFKEQDHDIKMDVEVTTKDIWGRDYNFSYASLGEIESKIKPILSNHGLMYFQTVGADCSVTTTLVHIQTGESVSDTASFPLEPGNQWQSYGQAITYLRRYSLVTLLGLKAEFDADANKQDGTPASFKVNGKPMLDADKFEAMVAYLREGKWQDVEKQINKYTLTEAQRTSLTTLINHYKTEALKAGQKK